VYRQFDDNIGAIINRRRLLIRLRDFFDNALAADKIRAPSLRRGLESLTTYRSMKRTYQPSKRSRKRQHGFRARMATKTGRDLIRRRRHKGRKRLVPKGAEIKFKRHTKQH